MVKKVHQVWFGPSPSPEIGLFMATVQKYSTGWTYKLWSEPDIDSFPLQAALIRNLIQQGKYSFANDLFRIAIVAKEGGCYVDCDFEFYSHLDEMLSRFASELDHKDALFCGERGATAGGFFFIPKADSSLGNILLKDIQSMFAQADGFQIQKLKDIHQKQEKRIFLLPTEFCFNYWTDGLPPKNPPAGSIMTHHWTGSWKDERRRKYFTDKHKLAAKYLLERNPELNQIS